MADIDEGSRKGIAPKDEMGCTFFLGHIVNNYMTVIYLA